MILNIYLCFILVIQVVPKFDFHIMVHGQQEKFKWIIKTI